MPSPKFTDYPLWFRIIVPVSMAIFVVNFCYFLAPTTALLLWTKSSITVRGLLTGLTPLVASFAGAWSAFMLARYQRKRDKIESDVAAGNRALFTLTVMYNELRQYQKEVVEPYRGKHDAWLNLHMTKPLKENLSFEMKELSFLMPGKASTFQHLLLEEERFRTAAYLVEEHRRLLLSEAWPRLEAAGVLLRENRSADEVQKIIGISTVRQLSVVTAAIINNVDEDVKSTLNAMNELRAALKSMFPTGKFIEFKPNGG
jgi:hypothetical protein